MAFAALVGTVRGAINEQNSGAGGCIAALKNEDKAYGELHGRIVSRITCRQQHYAVLRRNILNAFFPEMVPMNFLPDMNVTEP